jgi:hypothetical protein
LDTKAPIDDLSAKVSIGFGDRNGNLELKYILMLMKNDIFATYTPNLLLF